MSMQHAQYVLLFLELPVNSTSLKFYEVTCSSCSELRHLFLLRTIVGKLTFAAWVWCMVVCIYVSYMQYV